MCQRLLLPRLIISNRLLNFQFPRAPLRVLLARHELHAARYLVLLRVVEVTAREALLEGAGRLGHFSGLELVHGFGRGHFRGRGVGGLVLLRDH